MTRTPSRFDDLEARFRYLITGPKPLSLHGRSLGHGAPKRPITLAELRALLTEYENWPLHDAVMRELIRRANHPSGEPWMLSIVWMLLPALRKAAGDLTRNFPGDPADIEAELLTGLITAVRNFGPCGSRIAWHLVDKATSTARRLCRRETRVALGFMSSAMDRTALHPAWSVPGAADVHAPEPWHDPTYVLATAVRAQVLRPDEAELLAATQLDDHDLHELAAESSISYRTLRQRHLRARRKLRAFLDADVTRS